MIAPSWGDILVHNGGEPTAFFSDSPKRPDYAPFFRRLLFSSPLGMTSALKGLSHKQTLCE